MARKRIIKRPKIRRKRKAIRRRRNAPYPTVVLQAMGDWIEQTFTDVELPEDDKDRLTALSAAVEFMRKTYIPRVVTAKDEDTILDLLQDEGIDFDDLPDIGVDLNDAIQDALAEEASSSSSSSSVSSEDVEEELSSASVSVELSEDLPSETGPQSASTEADLEDLQDLFNALDEEEESQSEPQPEPQPRPQRKVVEPKKKEEKSTQRTKEQKGSTFQRGQRSKSASSSEDRTGADPFPQEEELKVSYIMTEYDRLRLNRFRSRSLRVRAELAPFFFFLQLRQRSYPLPTVKGWLTALQESDISLPFPLDFRTEQFRQNAFVLFRPSNGTTQLYLPSFNPISKLNKKSTVRARDTYWTPSLEFISRPEFTQKDLFSLVPTEVYMGKRKVSGKEETLVPSTIMKSHQIGSPNPLNPQSKLSWYQMLHGYIGVDNLNTPFRKKGKTDKFSAFGVLIFVDDSERPNEMKLRLVDYIPSPRPSYKQYLGELPKRGMIRPNPKRLVRRKNAKALPRKRKVLIVRKRR